MEREIVLVNANGETPCRLLRCRPEASAVILFCGEERFLLGDVRRLAPEYTFVLEAWEAELLGVEADAAVDVYCWAFIPQHKPQAAGFTLEKLLVVAESGRALEVRRSGGPCLSFLQG